MSCDPTGRRENLELEIPYTHILPLTLSPQESEGGFLGLITVM